MEIDCVVILINVVVYHQGNTKKLLWNNFYKMSSYLEMEIDCVVILINVVVYHQGNTKKLLWNNFYKMSSYFLICVTEGRVIEEFAYVDVLAEGNRNIV
jgi:hypothetical protein